MESIRAIEPPISNEYLNSYQKHVAEVGRLFDQTSIRLKPPVLEGTPYLLNIARRSETHCETHCSYPISIDLIHLGAQAVYGIVGCTLYAQQFSPSEVSVTGFYRNYTHRIGWWRTWFGSPIRNISGIIAPYEDAICQTIANRTGYITRRVVRTEKNKSTRFVQNYIRRGYKFQRPSPAIKFWVKAFSPQALPI